MMMIIDEISLNFLKVPAEVECWIFKSLIIMLDEND